MGGGSLIFKQNSTYYEHFYSQLEAYVHYVPIKHDLSDLLERLSWAKQNEFKVGGYNRYSISDVAVRLAGCPAIILFPTFFFWFATCCFKIP